MLVNLFGTLRRATRFYKSKMSVPLDRGANPILYCTCKHNGLNGFRPAAAGGGYRTTTAAARFNWLYSATITACCDVWTASSGDSRTRVYVQSGPQEVTGQREELMNSSCAHPYNVRPRVWAKLCAWGFR